MPRPNHQETFEILQRRKSVADRYLRGETQWKIGQALEVTRETIGRDLKAIRAEWLKSCEMLTAERMAQEVAKIDSLERQYQDAFLRSCQPRKVTSGKKHSGGQKGKESNSSETFLREEMRDGNPKFLDGVMKCIERRCELLGLLERKGTQAQTSVTVLAGVDLAVILGQKLGIPFSPPRGDAPTADVE